MEIEKSLAEALPDEINRVRRLQDEFKALRGMPNVVVEPQIIIMESEIQAAIKATAEGDTVAMLRCYEALTGYEN